MAITVNRTPVTVDPSSSTYKDTGNYFNHVEFKGLCDNRNVDTIDPQTFQDTENLYIDLEDTLASRPKLENHDMFGFTTINKMWIWDDEHLIYGLRDSKDMLFDVKNNIGLDLDEDLQQLVRIENRVYIFLQTKVYVYENLAFTQVSLQNIEDYFYIPSIKVISDGVEGNGEYNNEITNMSKIAVTASNSYNFNNDLPDGTEVTFSIGGETYKFTWIKDVSYLTIAAPYISKTFDEVCLSPNGTAVGKIGNTLYYSLDGSFWSVLQSIGSSEGIIKFGISGSGNFVWVVISNGLYIISIVATEYAGENLSPNKKYLSWTQIVEAGSNIVSGNGNINPSVDMLDFDRYVCLFQTTNNYVLAVAEGTTDGTINYFRQTYPINDNTRMKEARVQASYRIWDTSYLDYIFLRNDVGSYYVNMIKVSSGNIVNIGGQAALLNGSNVGNVGFNFPNPFGNSYSVANLDEWGIFFSNTVDDCPDLNSSTYSYLLASLKNSDGSYKFSDKTICITFVTSSNDTSIHGQIAYETTIIVEGDKTIRDTSQSNNYGYFSYVSFNTNINTTWTYYHPVKYIMLDRSTILCRLGLIKNGVLTQSILPIGEKTLSYIVPQWGALVGLSDVNPIPPVLTYSSTLDNSILSFSTNLTAFYVGNEIYANPFNNTISATYYSKNFTQADVWTGLFPKHFVETNNTQYWANDQTLYIEERKFTKDWKPILYFPEINTEIRPNRITNLLVIDRGIVALFNEYEVWYVTKVALDKNSSTYGYAYYKSRVGLGCKEGADVDILYDGATITYATPRGIVGMNYQNLTQNTDQILTFLSDNISDKYVQWYEASQGQIKIFKYKFWTLFYKIGTYECLVLDLRNGSWWFWNSKIENGLKELYLYEDRPLILDSNGNLMDLHQGYDGIYKDLDTTIIDWKATSQPLTFGAINNYKRIVGININAVQLTKDAFNYILICRNYKNRKNIYGPKVVDFEQEKITVGSYRTFVKRLNYIQSVKFQYTIANNSNLTVQSPISITAISTKYEIKGRVR